MASIGKPSAIGLDRQYVSAGEAGKLLGVQPGTVSSWEKTGAITAIRTGGNHRRFLLTEIKALRDGGTPQIYDRKIICYGRCSVDIQKENLNRQCERLKEYAKENYPDRKMVLYSEIGSGFTLQNRPVAWKLLQEIVDSKHNGSILLVHSRDRLSRFMVDVWELLCNKYGIEIHYIDNDNDKDSESTFSSDIISTITYFSVRWSAKKSGKRQSKPLTPETIERGLQLIGAGHSTNLIHEMLTAEGFTASRHTVRKYILTKREALQTPVAPVENSARTYRENCTAKGNETQRLLVDILWADYLAFCSDTGKPQLTKRMFLRQFSDYKGCSYTSRENVNKSANAYIGLIIRDKPELNIIVRPQQRKATPIENQSLEGLLKFSDGLKGKQISSKKLQLNYQQWCKGQGLTPMKRSEIFRHVDRLALSKRTNGHLFEYQF